MNLLAQSTALRVAAAFLAAAFAWMVAAADRQPDDVTGIVDRTIQPVMKKYGIPGMAIGVVVDGRRYLVDYGVASTETRKPVTHGTLFEIGSISKTLTATLASYAQVSGLLNLSDRTDKYLPPLQGSRFGEVVLLELGTHTAGGLPLQVPETIENDAQLMKYLEGWQPTYAPGTYRTYGNPGIGMLGLIAAGSLNEDFVTLIERRIFPALGMSSSHVNVPAADMANYAQGYTAEGAPIRVHNGILSAETYGVKTTAADLLRFVEANMDLIGLEPKLRRAITDTHAGYFAAGQMTQDLIWEQYAYPAGLPALLAGNSPAMLFDATPVRRLVPPLQPRADVLINKTGSTNGFAAYVAFVPEKKLGVVILANKSYPIEDRVTMAYQIMTALDAR
jgi:beta-lactamase class C